MRVLEHGETGNVANHRLDLCERIAYLNDIGTAIWLERRGKTAQVRTRAGTLIEFGNGAPDVWEEPVIAPSPNGRYVALMLVSAHTLWIYDRTRRHWANLGDARISPAQDWDYIKPAWDPWFADSSQLAFFSGANLVVSSPDGRTKRVVCWLSEWAGLAVPSPDGQWIAFATFEGRPRQMRPDLKAWGSQLWVVPTSGGSRPRAVTGPDPDTTSGLRWRGNDYLVFDRIAENLMNMHARIWKVGIH